MAGTATLAENDLRYKGLSILEENLGVVETLRFLALLNREPFDYQAWQDREFGHLTLDELFAEIEAIEDSEPR